jgi:hypothetical protein
VHAQELKNLLITVPGIKRPHQTASDATGSLTPGGGTKGGTQLHHQHLHSHASFLSPKGPASSSLASTGESALLLSSATMGLGASRRNVMNLPPLRSKSDLGGSAASDTVRSGGPGVPAEGTTVTTVRASLCRLCLLCRLPRSLRLFCRLPRSPRLLCRLPLPPLPLLPPLPPPSLSPPPLPLAPARVRASAGSAASGLLRDAVMECE